MILVHIHSNLSCMYLYSVDSTSATVFFFLKWIQVWTDFLQLEALTKYLSSSRVSCRTDNCLPAIFGQKTSVISKSIRGYDSLKRKKENIKKSGKGKKKGRKKKRRTDREHGYWRPKLKHSMKPTEDWSLEVSALLKSEVITFQCFTLHVLASQPMELYIKKTAVCFGNKIKRRC